MWTQLAWTISSPLGARAGVMRCPTSSTRSTQPPTLPPCRLSCRSCSAQMTTRRASRTLHAQTLSRQKRRRRRQIQSPNAAPPAWGGRHHTRGHTQLSPGGSHR